MKIPQWKKVVPLLSLLKQKTEFKNMGEYKRQVYTFY